MKLAKGLDGEEWSTMNFELGYLLLPFAHYMLFTFHAWRAQSKRARVDCPNKNTHVLCFQHVSDYHSTKFCVVGLIYESSSNISLSINQVLHGWLDLGSYFFTAFCAEALYATYLSSCTWAWRCWITVQSSASEASSGVIQTFDCNKSIVTFIRFMHESWTKNYAWPCLVDSNETLWVMTNFYLRKSYHQLFAIVIASIN